MKPCMKYGQEGVLFLLGGGGGFDKLLSSLLPPPPPTQRWTRLKTLTNSLLASPWSVQDVGARCTLPQ